MNRIILLGAGGHARVLQAILEEAGVELHGFVAPNGGLLGDAVRWLGNDEALEPYDRSTCLLVNGLGSVGEASLRMGIFEKYRAMGFSFLSLRSGSAVVSASVVMGEGVQVMHGAILQVDARIGDNCIVNTGAIVEHHNIIGAHCHISVGAVLCGNVAVGRGSHIGAGATVLQGVRIGENCIVGAGAVVLRDVPDHHTAVGVPVKMWAHESAI